MKNVFKILTLVVFVFAYQNTNAQLLKKLRKKAQEKVTAIEDKVVEKLETKSDKKIDDVFEGKKRETNDDDFINNKPKGFENKKIEDYDDIKSKSNISGSAIIKHSDTYGNFNIEEFGKAITLLKNDEVRIYGSWVTMSADIQDGYVLVIPNGQKLLFDDDEPKQEQIKLRIPEDAQLELSYDPVYDPEYEDENGFSSAVTTDYQSYSIDSGEAILDVLSKDNLQISFSGDIQLVTRSENPNKNSEDRYLLSYSPASVSGMVDIGPVNFVDRRTNSKNSSKTYKTPKLSESTNQPEGIYQFTSETIVKVTSSENNRTYNMSYLINPSTNYIGMKADMSEYSDEEMDGESIIIMDNGDAHIFVETQGMKMRISQGMMGGQQMQNPTDQMANYDYSNITKTGRTKTVIGATCYEYVMSDDNVKIELWVAPEVNLPNWFIQNDTVLKGHIMEYTITSKDGNMKSETIAINDNISKTIDPKEYRKMF